jgi:hypothetical protein
MTSHAEKILKHFAALNRALVAKGFPAISPWWHDTITRFYRSGKRQLVGRVGRRGGKSSSLCRLGVTEALYGEHRIPPGDMGIVAIISARRSDALERLRTIKAILDAIDVRYIERGDSVELVSRRIAFTVYTASISGVSGFTGIFILCDEVAKWKDSDTGANPATVVIASVRPTIATQPNARIFLSSSPMGLLDAHADAFALGETPLQFITHAETWMANPSITEEQTHELEPDPIVWAREYAAIPQAENETSLLSQVSLDKLSRAPRAVDPTEPAWLTSSDSLPCPRHRYLATMDPATRGNAWTLAITTLSDERIRKVVLTREWIGTKQKPLVAGKVFAEMAPILAFYNLRHVHSDQFSEDTLREIASQHGVYLIVDTPWSASTKADAFDGLRTIVRESRLELPPDDQVKTDLLGIRERLTRSGIVYELATVGSRHSDHAASIAMGVMLVKAPPTPILTVRSSFDESEHAKRQFLKERQKERERADKYGRLPVTHR